MQWAVALKSWTSLGRGGSTMISAEMAHLKGKREEGRGEIKQGEIEEAAFEFKEQDSNAEIFIR